MVELRMITLNEIEALENNVKRAKESVELGSALDRLRTNRDFKKIITEGYFREEAVRLVHLKSDSNSQSEVMQGSIVKQMDSIGALAQYFYVVSHRAAMASRSIAVDEETLTELMTEEVQ